MAFRLFLIAWGGLAVTIVLYVLTGLKRDFSAHLRRRRTEELLPTLSILLFDSNDKAGEAYELLAKVNRGVLLDVSQSLSLDINGEARQRLQQLARSTGLERSIRRRSKHRRWRHRVQAAQLHYLVTHPDFNRSPLLSDRHPQVRARAAEALTAEQAVIHVADLAKLLGDDSLAVRMGAQNSLISAGAAAVEPLLDLLGASGPHVSDAMEVAANLPDTRLVKALAKYAHSTDARLREMTANALGGGTGLGAIDLLHELIGDDEASVRAAAISALARLESRESVGIIGQMLADREWRVRRAAGYALDGLGAAGQLILRRALTHSDPYARDMARQVLDGSMALSARANAVEYVGAS